MPQKLPVLQSRDIIKALEKGGFLLKRQTGSHAILFKPGLRRPVSVPVHAFDMPVGTLRAIIRQANLTIEEFLNLL